MQEIRTVLVNDGDGLASGDDGEGRVVDEGQVNVQL